MKSSIIVLLFIISAFLCGRFACHTNTSNTIYKTKIDTVVSYNTKIIYQDTGSLHYKTITKTINGKIDTFKTISDTISNGEGSTAVIDDTLSNGQITGRSVDLNIKQLTITDSIFITKKVFNNGIYLMPKYDLITKSFGGDVQYHYKSFIFSTGYINRGIQIGIGFKISK